jgi:hypothetical protein
MRPAWFPLRRSCEKRWFGGDERGADFTGAAADARADDQCPERRACTPAPFSSGRFPHATGALMAREGGDRRVSHPIHAQEVAK